jgi:hypothetical protein
MSIAGSTGQTSLNVTGNAYISNAVTTTNVFTTGIQTIAGLAGLTSLNVTGNAYISNAVTTTNLYANTMTLIGTTGQTTINVTGNIYASNSLSTTNVFASNGLDVGPGTLGSNVVVFSNISGGSNVFVMDSNGRVTIGSTYTGGSLLSFGQQSANKVVTLFDGNSADNPVLATNFYGFGRNTNVLRYQVNDTGAAHTFYGGSSEFTRITNTGVGILTGANPTSTLQVTGNSYISNAVTTTNIFAVTATVPGFTSQFTVNGGGTVTWSSGNNLLWGSTVLVIPAWRNSAYATAGFWDINCPTSGTIVYNSGTVTCTAAGIPVGGWAALYYRVVPGTSQASVQANFILKDLSDTIYSPNSNWILLAVRNGNTNELKWMPGNTTIAPGGTFYTPSASFDKVQVAGTVVVDSTRSASFLNVFSSNAVTTTNVFANTLTMSNASSTINVTGNIYASNAVTTTNLFTAGITSNVTSTIFNSDTLTIPFVYSTTLNVASTSNLDVVTITGEPGLTSLNVTGNAFVSNALTTTNVFASDIILASSTLGTVVAGQMEYNTYLYGTINTTSGRGSVPIDYIYRLTTPTAAYGIASNNFFTGTATGTGARLNLEASSVYDIEAYCYFTKTTAGTVTWILATSSAPTLITAAYTASPITGISGGTPVTSYVGGVTTAVTFQTTGSLSGGVSHSFLFKIQVLTNLATTFGITATQSAGTMTSLAGSYYRVTKLSTTTGEFA